MHKAELTVNVVVKDVEVEVEVVVIQYRRNLPSRPGLSLELASISVDGLISSLPDLDGTISAPFRPSTVIILFLLPVQTIAFAASE